MKDHDPMMKENEEKIRSSFNVLKMSDRFNRMIDTLNTLLHRIGDPKRAKKIEKILARLKVANRHSKYVSNDENHTTLKKELDSEFQNQKDEYDALRKEFNFLHTTSTQLKSYIKYLSHEDNKLDTSRGFFWHNKKTDNCPILYNLNRIYFRSYQLIVRLKQVYTEHDELVTLLSNFIRVMDTNLEVIKRYVEKSHLIGQQDLHNDDIAFLEDLDVVGKIQKMFNDSVIEFNKIHDDYVVKMISRITETLRVKYNEIKLTLEELERDNDLEKAKKHKQASELIFGKKKNILILTIPFHIKSGVITNNRMILRNINQHKYNVYVITHWFNDYSFFDRFANDTVNVSTSPYNLHDINEKKLYMKYSIERVLLELKENYLFVPDVVHLHTHTYEIDGTLDIIKDTLGNPPIVYTVHQLVPYKPLEEQTQLDILNGRVEPEQLQQIMDSHYTDKKMGQKGALQKADYAITISETHKTALLKFFPEYHNKVLTIPNSTDIYKHAVGLEAEIKRIRNHIGKDKIVLLHVGRVEAQKRPDILLQGFNKICERYENVVLQMVGVGGGDKSKIMKELIDEFGLDSRHSDKIELVEWVKRDILPAYYMAADILVYPLVEFDLYSCAALEALSLGTPVITCKGEYSIFGNATTAENMAHAFENYLKDKESIKKHYEKIKEEIRGKFSVHNFINNHEEVYDALIEHRSPRIKQQESLIHPFQEPKEFRKKKSLEPELTHPWNKDILPTFDGNLNEVPQIIEELDKIGIENYRFYIMCHWFFDRKILEEMGCEFSKMDETSNVPVKCNKPEYIGNWMKWFEEKANGQNLDAYIYSLIKDEIKQNAEWIVEYFKSKYKGTYDEELSKKFGFHTTILHPPTEHPQHISNYSKEEMILNELQFFEYLMKLVFKVNSYKVLYGRTPGGGGFLYGDDDITQTKSKRLQGIARGYNEHFKWRVWRLAVNTEIIPKERAQIANNYRHKKVRATWWDTDPCEILMHTYVFNSPEKFNKFKEFVTEMDQITEN
ncbi:glycosyltransferase family 4 protein [Candidatus Woesearchaeota archaeon]|nr:glycosyltransferase family 4 protein [Candidatus Woesearchaeota archaeon]